MPLQLLPDSIRINDLLQMLKDVSAHIPVRHLSPIDSMVDSKEEYVLTRLASGRFSLKPNITRQGLLFRGDSGFHEPFYSRFGQKGIKGHGEEIRKKIIPVNVRRSDFETTIESFPLYEMLKSGVSLPNGKKLVVENPFGLAYAYDYTTPFVGLTSDLNVAAFYAVTEYDTETHRFVPKESGKGVLYAFELRFPFSMTIGLSTLGRLLFPRTLRQKTFLFNIDPSLDFNNTAVVTGFVFNHDAAQSRRIYEAFHDGELLSPSDDFLMNKIASFPKDTVSRRGLARNFAENPNDNHDDIVRIVGESGLEIGNEFNPEFTYDDLKGVYKDIAGYWQSMLDGVYIGGNHGKEMKDFLLRLPWNPDYARYFDLDKYFDAR